MKTINLQISFEQLTDDNISEMIKYILENEMKYNLVDDNLIKHNFKIEII